MGCKPGGMPSPVRRSEVPAAPLVDEVDPRRSEPEPLPRDVHEPFVAAHPAEHADPAEERTDLYDAFERGRFAFELEQTNPIAKQAGNGGDICGGAAVTSALILTADSPEAAAANAAALKKVADDREAWNRLPAPLKREDVEAALEHFGHGVMTPNDAALLQQLAYAAGRSLDKQRASPGTSPLELGALVTQLQSNGARLQGTRFVQVKGAAQQGHWVATKDEHLLDSLKLNVLASHLKRGGPAWDSEVAVSSGKVEVFTRGGGRLPAARGASAYRLEVDPKEMPRDKFRALDKSLADRWLELTRGAEARGPVSVR